jgi:hypothetical protein
MRNEGGETEGVARSEGGGTRDEERGRNEGGGTMED